MADDTATQTAQDTSNASPAEPTQATDTSTQTQTQTDIGSIFGEYAKDPSIQKFKTPADLAKSYIELERLIGKKRLPIPEKPEEYDEVFKQLGYPENPDGYQVDDAYKEVLGEDSLNALKKLAHESGLLPHQFQRMVDNYVAFLQEQQKQAETQTQQAIQEAMNALKQEWGAKFEENIAAAQSLFQRLPDSLKAKIEMSGLGNDPEFIKLMTEMSHYVLEGNAKFTTTMTPADAQAELQKILSDVNGPYYNKTHPEHAATVERVSQLYEMISGGEE